MSRVAVENGRVISITLLPDHGEMIGGFFDLCKSVFDIVFVASYDESWSFAADWGFDVGVSFST